ncbi:O-antigen ligase family protein [Aliarcobacter butzleri]
MSVILGILKINIPIELIVYLIVLFLILLMNINSESNKFIFLKNKVAVYCYIFVGLIVIFIPISISNIAVIEKITFFIYLVICKVLILSLLNFENIFYKYLIFLKYLRNSASIILILYFVLFYLGFTEYFGSEQRKYLVGTGNPIWFSRFIVDLTFIVLFYTLYTKKFHFISFLSILLGILLLFNAGSRGPFLALFLATIFSYLNLNSSKKKIIYSILIISLILVAPVLIPKILNFNIYSVLTRIDLYEKSINFILENPWGTGFASFGLLFLGEDVRFYPHNIFLEILVELGIGGLIIFILFIYNGFKSYSSKNIFFYLFFIAFINAQFSGDLTSNSYMFIYLFLSVVYKRYERRQNHEALSLCYGKYSK